MAVSVRPEDQAIGSRVVQTMLRPRAEPPQLRQEFGEIMGCHRHLFGIGFQLIEKRENYGGPSLESGKPMSPILLWRQERVLVRIKPRGEDAGAKFRQGLAHMSVCLVSGSLGADGRMDTGWGAEVGKFSFRGQLVAKTPGAAIGSAVDHLKKSAGETWSDETHFQFPDLVCDDSQIDTLKPSPL